MIFNSKTIIRTASDQSDNALPDFIRPVQIAQQQGATSQAEQLLTNVGEITQQKREQKINEAPFGVFDLESYQPHISSSPGEVSGRIHVITDDMDNDRQRDYDEVGRPIAITYRKSLDSSGKYYTVNHPTSEISDPRVQRFLRAAGMSSLPVYISKANKSHIERSYKPFAKYINEENLYKNLSAATTAGHEFTSDKIRDVDEAGMRILSDPDGARKAVRAFYTGEQQPLFNTNVGVDYCVCGQRRDNHSTSACRNFLPLTVSDGTGNYANGNVARSSQSPMRNIPDMQQDTLQHALEGIDIINSADEFVSNEPDHEQHVPTVFVSDQTPFHQRIINKLAATLNKKPQSIMMKSIASKLVKCTACNGKGKINQARSGAIDNPNMLADSDGTSLIPSYENDIDPTTGELVLKRSSGSKKNEWASRGTSPNVCPACDFNNVPLEDLEEYARYYKGDITPAQVLESLRQNPGKKLRIGKPRREREVGFIKQMVDHQPGNPIYLATANSANAGIAYGEPDPNCATCGGDHNHRVDKKPCDCRIADPTHIDIDNPVALPGSEQEPIDEHGNLHIPVALLDAFYKSQGKEMPTLFKQQIARAERILPNEQLSSSSPDFFITENRSSTDRKRGIQRFRGKHGSWSSWVLSDGKPALNDNQQRSVAGYMPSGIVLSSDQKDQFKTIRAQINASSNAKECAHSQQLKAISSFFQSSLDTLAPTAGSLPDIPNRAVRMPNRFQFIGTKMLSSPDVNLDQPGYGTYHPMILQHVAGIDSKVNKLKQKLMIDPEDEKFNGLLKNIYDLSSKSANTMSEFGSLSVGVPGSPGTSDVLFNNVSELAQHMSKEYGQDTARTVLSPIASMVAPYIPSSNKVKA